MVKSVWAQFGLGGKSRDADVLGAPVRVSEDAQAKSIDKKAANLEEFNRHNRDRIPERPNTSAGPASSFAKRKNADKRETKDDLHFNPLALHGRGTTFYNFPLPGSLPTPEHSPKTFAPSVDESSLVRPSTPESMEIVSTPAPVTDTNSKMEVPHGQIGMALGSPSHAPAAWQEYSVETYIRHESPDQMDVSVDGSWDNPAPKHKQSRWKKLGGIFGGGKKAPSAFYQLEPEPSQPSEPDHVQEPVSSEKRPKSRGRGWSNSTKRKHKPELSRSNTTPALTMSGARTAAGTPEIRLEGGPLMENALKSAQKGAGLLDVDIPSVQMERYSIMFSGVLQGPNQTSSSSLLARRQATLDKLKTVNEALALKEQEIEAKSRLLPRRATSPSATKTQSPAFSLFPNTPSRTRDLSPSSRHGPSGSLQRSNTSPAALSPSRPSFAPGPDNEAHARLMVKEHGSPEKKRDGSDSRANKIKAESGRPSTASPTPKASPWSPNKSHLTLEDNSEVEDDDEGIVIIDGTQRSPSNPIHFPMKPKLVEPDWQIINPPTSHPAPSVSGSTTSESAPSTSTSNTSSSSALSTGLPAKPNVPSPALTSSIRPEAQARARAMSTSRPAQGRSRSTTTTTTIIPNRSQPAAETIDSPTLHPEPIRSLNTTISSSSSPQPPSRPSLDSQAEEETQARLNTLANVSIARQISVSRQQRQLLIPIKTSSGSLRRSPGPSPNPSTNSNSKPSTPSPMVNTTSPLTAVAVAAQEASSPRPSSSRERAEGKSKERLVDAVKAATPTIVVVNSEREEEWDAATRRLKVGDKVMGLAERRRMLVGKNAGSGGMSREREARERDLQMQMQNRKSERVVVERVSVVST